MLARNKRTGEFFAMKRLKKSDIIKLSQVDHVISENTILADIDHPFLVSNHGKNMHLSFGTTKHVYRSDSLQKRALRSTFLAINYNLNLVFRTLRLDYKDSRKTTATSSS